MYIIVIFLLKGNFNVLKSTKSELNWKLVMLPLILFMDRFIQIGSFSVHLQSGSVITKQDLSVPFRFVKLKILSQKYVVNILPAFKVDVISFFYIGSI